MANNFNILDTPTGGSGILSAASSNKDDGQGLLHATVTVITYNNPLFDNLSEMSAAGVFTAQETGQYHVSASLLTNGASWALNKALEIALFKNGVQYAIGTRLIAQVATTVGFSVAINTDIDVVAGDILDIRAVQNSGVTVNTSVTALYNNFSVHRIGV